LDVYPCVRVVLSGIVVVKWRLVIVLERLLGFCCREGFFDCFGLEVLEFNVDALRFIVRFILYFFGYDMVRPL